MEEEILEKVEFLSAILRQTLLRYAEIQNLSVTQAKILGLISNGRGNLSEIAREMGITLPTASDSLKLLKKKGLVEHKENERDTRIKQLFLTDAGKKLSNHLANYNEGMKNLLAKMHMSDRAQLNDGLENLCKQLQKKTPKFDL